MFIIQFFKTNFATTIDYSVAKVINFYIETHFLQIHRQDVEFHGVI